VNHKNLTLRVFGIAIFFAVVIGCGFPDGDSLENSSSITVGENTARFDIIINSGELAGDEDIFRIKKNENVSLNFSSDADIKVHLHGYDIEKTVYSGNDQTMEFKANATGRFVITSHGIEAENREHGAHSAHPGPETDPDNVIVKPGVLIEWKIDSDEKVRLISGLPPSDQANHESKEKTLITLEVYP
jgi:hypothetical protein